MGALIITFAVVLILSLVKIPPKANAKPGPMTESERRKRIKRGQKAFRDERYPPGGLRWMGNRKSRGKKDKYFWDD